MPSTIANVGLRRERSYTLLNTKRSIKPKGTMLNIGERRKADAVNPNPVTAPPEFKNNSIETNK